MRKLLIACFVLGCGHGEPTQPQPQRARPAEPASSERGEPATAKSRPRGDATQPDADASPGAVPKAPAGDASPKPSDCLARYEFNSDTSVLEEQRRRGGAKRWDDFATSYPAAYLDPDADLPVEAVATFRIGDTPLLWFRPDFAEAVVNAAVLSELKVVNATTLSPKQRVTIGTLTELGIGKIDGRTLAHFLLRADVVQTYVHIGSSVCLQEAETTAAGFRGRYAGEHVYFTNAENRDAFAFELTLSPEGTLAIEGLAPR